MLQLKRWISENDFWGAIEGACKMNNILDELEINAQMGARFASATSNYASIRFSSNFYIDGHENYIHWKR